MIQTGIIDELIKEKFNVPLGFDKRQNVFRGVVKDLKASKEWSVLDVINIEVGWPASSVDLGWLQDVIHFYRDKGSFNSEMIGNILDTFVQRLKERDIKETEEGYRITFATKDDHGWYDYAFYVFDKDVK